MADLVLITFIRLMMDDSIQTGLSVDGRNFDRVRYGDEKDHWEADYGPCHDCGVRRGEVHIFGCDVERCPVCGGKVVYCECEFDDQLIREKRQKLTNG